MTRILKLILLVIIAVVFIPAFIIVTLLNKTWSKLIKEVIGHDPL